MSEEIVIESGIPIPRSLNGIGNGKWRSIVEKMKDGDSFACTENQAQAFRSAAIKMGFKIITRKADGGVRTWLIKKTP